MTRWLGGHPMTNRHRHRSTEEVSHDYSTTTASLWPLALGAGPAPGGMPGNTRRDAAPGGAARERGGAPGAPRQTPPVQPMPTPSQGDTPKGREGLTTPGRAVTPTEPVWGEAQRRLPPGYEDKLQQLCRILSVSSIAGMPCS